MASPGSSPGMEPLIILTFTCGGTELLRAALAHDPELAFTSSTGMLPLCRQAVMVWNRAEGHRKAAASVLARKSVFVMLSAQISVILAGAGKSAGVRQQCQPRSARNRSWKFSHELSLYASTEAVPEWSARV